MFEPVRWVCASDLRRTGTVPAEVRGTVPTVPVPAARSAGSSPEPAAVVRERRRSSAATRIAQLPRTGDALDRYAELAARVLGAASAHVCLVTDVEDIAGSAEDTPGGTRPLADSICRLAVDGAVVVPDARADPRVRQVSLVQDGTIGSFLGEPLTVAEGLVVGTLCVFDPRPRPWSDADREALRTLAAAVVTELRHAELVTEFESSRLRWGLAIDAGGIGSFDWDLDTGVLAWDDRLIELFGYEPATFDSSIESFNARVHPDDLGRVGDAITRSIEGVTDFEAEYRVVLPAGATRWVRARGRTLGDADGRPVRLLGAAYDTTEEQSGETRVARLLEAMPTALLSVDREWRFTYVNSAAERLLDVPRSDLLSRSLWDAYPATSGSAFEDAYRRAVETGEPQSVEAWYPLPLEAWFEVRAWPTPEGLTLFFLDVTERHVAQEQAARSARRLALLAEVGAELTGIPDGSRVIARIAQLLVPAVADGCIVTTVDDVGRPRHVASWHRDPALRPLLDTYARARLHSPSPGRVVDSRPEQPGPSSRRAEFAADRQPLRVRQALQEVGVARVLGVPMRGRGRTTGLISLLYSPAREPDADDRDTAQDVADRAGLALDDALVFDRHQLLAEGLQRSLLTEPPQPDHLEVAVRYVPDAESARVGGDWYDAFVQPGGSTMLVIGDVVGHDTEAAATMGQLRGLLRGIATYSDAGPAEVLRGLDSSIAVLEVPALATVAVARFESDGDGTRMRWANAGHLPPVVVDPAGGLTVLGGWSGDLLLGVDPATRRTEHTVDLASGSTVVLYTDGLVERRDADLDAGLARLTDALTEFAALPPEALCDALVERLVDGRPDDDVALVLVRLHDREPVPG